MLQTTKDRLAARRDADHGEGGFTLIELMVVVLIIAILLAIAIPTFLGAQNKSKNRSAQSSLRNSVTAAKTIYADTGSYATATSGNLDDVEPSITFVANDAPSDGPKKVSVKADATAWYGAAESETGSCYFIRDIVTGTGAGTQFATAADTASCTADSAAATTGVTYSPDGW